MRVVEKEMEWMRPQSEMEEEGEEDIITWLQLRL